MTTRRQTALAAGDASAGATTIATRVRDRARASPTAWRCGRSTSASGRRSPGRRTGTQRAAGRRTRLLALGVEPGDRVAIHSENRPEWLFADVGHRRPSRAITVGLYPTNPPAEVALPAAALRREGAHRRGPGAGRQGARRDRRPARPGAHRLPRAARHPRTATTTRGCCPGTTCSRSAREHRAAHPGAVERAHGRSRARRRRDADLHLGHDRAAQGRDAHDRQRRVRDRDAGRRRRLHSTRRRTGRPRRSRTCRCATSPSASSRPGSTPPPACRCTSPSRSRPCSRTCARCSRRSSSACRASGRRCTPASRSGCASRVAGSSGANYRVLDAAWRAGSARRWSRNGGTHTVGDAAARTRSAGVFLLPRAAGAASGCASAATQRRAPRRSRRRCSSSSWASACRCTRSTGMTENTAVATANRPGRIKLGTVGEPHPGSSCRSTRRPARSSPGTAACSPATGDDPEATARGHRRRRLAAHRRRRRVGRRHARADHRPDQGHHHHRGRQEHLAVARSRTRSSPRRTSRRPSSSATGASTSSR